MHRACLAEEAGAELLEDAVGIDENLQKAPHRGRIVGCIFPVLRKPSRLRQFVGHLVDRDVNAEVCKVSHDSGIEACHRLSGQCQLPLCAVAGGDPQGMIDEVEIDLEGPRPIGDRRGGQPACGDVQRDMPGMIEPGRARQPDLADDLGPQMQRLAGFPPGRSRQFRPGRLRGITHGSPQPVVISIS